MCVWTLLPSYDTRSFRRRALEAFPDAVDNFFVRLFRSSGRLGRPEFSVMSTTYLRALAACNSGGVMTLPLYYRLVSSGDLVFSLLLLYSCHSTLVMLQQMDRKGELLALIAEPCLDCLLSKLIRDLLWTLVQRATQ